MKTMYIYQVTSETMELSLHHPSSNDSGKDVILLIFDRSEFSPEEFASSVIRTMAKVDVEVILTGNV